VQKAVITNFHKPGGQHVLEETAHKFHDVKSHGSPAIGFMFTVFEKDSSIFELYNTAVGDGDFKHIGSQVLETALGGTDGLTVDNPVLIPDIGINLGIKVAVFDDVAEFGLEDFRHGLDRQKKIDSGTVPFAVGFGQRPTGHDVMDVGMIGHFAAPGMQHPEKPGHIGTDVSGIGGQFFNCL